jgi:hypothetical protein
MARFQWVLSWLLVWNRRISWVWNFAAGVAPRVRNAGVAVENWRRFGYPVVANPTFYRSTPTLPLAVRNLAWLILSCCGRKWREFVDSTSTGGGGGVLFSRILESGRQSEERKFSLMIMLHAGLADISMRSFTGRNNSTLREIGHSVKSRFNKSRTRKKDKHPLPPSTVPPVCPVTAFLRQGSAALSFNWRFSLWENLHDFCFHEKRTWAFSYEMYTLAQFILKKSSNERLFFFYSTWTFLFTKKKKGKKKEMHALGFFIHVKCT